MWTARGQDSDRQTDRIQQNGTSRLAIVAPGPPGGSPGASEGTSASTVVTQVKPKTHFPRGPASRPVVQIPEKFSRGRNALLPPVLLSGSFPQWAGWFLKCEPLSIQPDPPEFAPCAPLSLSCPVLGLQPSGLSWTLGSVFLTQGATRLCWAPRPGPRPGNSLEPGRVAVIDPVLTGPLPSAVWCPASRKSPFRIFYLLSVVSGRRGKPGPIWAIRAAHLMGRSRGAFRNGLG